MTATDIHGSHSRPKTSSWPPQPTTSGASATNGTVWERITNGSRLRSARWKRCISTARASPTTTPTTNPVIATRNVNHMPSSTTWATVRLLPRTSRSRKRWPMVHTCGMARSSVVAGSRSGPILSSVARPRAL